MLTPTQQKLQQYMPEPEKINYSKTIISPMPGAIVSVAVQVGDEVLAGQEILVMEAMKMQNIIKSEVDAKVKAVHVTEGGSVAVNAVMVEFE